LSFKSIFDEDNISKINDHVKKILSVLKHRVLSRF